MLNAVKASANRGAVIRWKDDGSLNGVDFTRDILPLLQRLRLSHISKGLGCCDSYSSKICRGIFTPHERHWAALKELGGSIASYDARANAVLFECDIP